MRFVQNTRKMCQKNEKLPQTFPFWSAAVGVCLYSVGISHQRTIHGFCRLPSLLNRPDDQRLSSVHVSGSKDARHVRFVPAFPGIHIGPRIHLHLKRLRHIGLASQKACRDQHQLRVNHFLAALHRRHHHTAGFLIFF